MGSAAYPQHLFLWCMAAIYMFAFTSLYFQIPGLYGKNGILPAAPQLKPDALCADSNENCEGWASVGECKSNPTWMLKNCMKSCQVCKEGEELPLKEKMKRKFTLLWLSPYLGLDIETGMELICILGTLLSLGVLLFQRLRNKLSFLALWGLYFSLYQVGQTFLWFQWDILLLETGVLTVIIAPFFMASPYKPGPDEEMLFWLVRWLLFRLMFASGVVKLTSRCPTWWGLTALNVHYESQCIPTPLAWYAHQLPEWFQRLSVVATYVIEIVMPFLFFAPIRSLRILAFYSQILLQILIIMTGNYNFFNLLTCTLCLSLVDDKYIVENSPAFVKKMYFRKPLPKEKDSTWKRFLRIILYWSTLITIIAGTVKLFDLKISKGAVLSKITFTQSWFFQTLKTTFPVVLGIGIVAFCIQLLISFYRTLFLDLGKIKKVFRLLRCCWFTYLAIWSFGVSLCPFSDLDGDTKQSLWPVIYKWYQKSEKYHVANSYGLFRSMTGVGGRPELIIEGSNDPNGGWKEYNFNYKPGNVSERLPFCTPHQPRLDWQMWFAALGSYQHNPWFVNLIYRLLHGHKEVLNLLGKNPFPDKPPKYIRSILFKYHYTLVSKQSAGVVDGFLRSRKIKKWWKREISHEYTNPLTKDHVALIKYIEDMGWDEKSIADASWKPSGKLYKVLSFLREAAVNVNPTIFILQLFIIPILTSIISKLQCNKQ